MPVDERSTTPMRPRPKLAPVVGVSSVLGPYHLLAELGSGGMATVYLAESSPDSTHDEGQVAVKVLHEHLARERQHVDAFLDEGRIGLLLHHPSVCEVIDYGEEMGRPYVVMELIDGVSLEAIQTALERRPALADDADWSRQIASITAAIADGLHAAHELLDERRQPLGLVHRDVTPENLYVTTAGGVRLSDFGVARLRTRRNPTREGVIKGKLAYAAPELFHGAAPDRRIDVWSLGVVLWELLTGRALFRLSNDAEVTRAILDTRIVPPSQWQPAIPAALDAIVMQALERDPERRFATAQELATALRAWLLATGGVPGTGERREWLVQLAVAMARAT